MVIRFGTILNHSNLLNLDSGPFIRMITNMKHRNIVMNYQTQTHYNHQFYSQQQSPSVGYNDTINVVFVFQIHEPPVYITRQGIRCVCSRGYEPSH